MIKSISIKIALFCIAGIPALLGQVRYKDIYFSNYSLQSDIQYGQAQTVGGSTMNLLLDVYTPSGDTETKRPLLIFLHGGGLTGGDKVSGYGTRVCTTMAKKGYVVASINYRIGVPTDTDTAYYQALYRGIQDGKAAVRFFRRYASLYGIDTSQIFLTGSSAGSKIALHMAYLDQSEVPSRFKVSALGTLEGSSGNPGYTSNVHGVISGWGALDDYRWIQAGNAPLYCVHGMTDNTVAVDSSFSYHNLGIFKYGSQILYNYAQSIGLYSGLRLFYNTGHTLDNNATKQDSAITDFSLWLYTVLKSNYRTTYYVDAVSGNDANAGTTPALAWRTLAKVNGTTFSPGDSILLKCGQTWTEQLYPKGSGTAGRPVTVGKYGTGSAPLLNGNGALTNVVYLFNQEYWVIRDLEIKNQVLAPDNVMRRGVYILGQDYGTIRSIKLINLNIHDISGDVNDKDACGIFAEIKGSATPTIFDTLLVDSCRIVDVDRTGMATTSTWDTRTYTTNTNWYPSTNVVVRNTWFERSAGNGLIMRVAARPLIERNTFKQCGLKVSGNAVFPFNCDDALLQYNEAYLTVYNAGDQDASAFDSDYRCKRTVIQYNYSHDNDGGFLVVTCQGGPDRFNDSTIVRYNISQNDHGDILYCSGQITNTFIYNNVIYSGPGNAYTHAVNHNSWNAAWPADTRYQNNIFSLSATPNYDFGSSTNTTFYNNVFYAPHPASEPADPAKLTSDPKFVSPGTGGIGIGTLAGYKLQSGSPAINSGLLFSGHAVMDFWGNPVPDGTVDRGAYEHQLAQRYFLTVNASNGSVVKSPNLTAYDSGATVQLTATPSAHYHFTGWTGDVPPGSETNNPLTLTMNANKTLTANFAIDTHTLSVTAADGTVSTNPSSGPFAYGSTVTLTATPATGYRFVNWTGDVPAGDESDNPLALLIDGNKSLTAHFVADQGQIFDVFYDNFNRADAAPVSGGGTPAMTYTSVNTGNGSSSISTNMIRIVCAPSGSAGRSYVTGPLASFASPYHTTLSSNTDVITWSFNVRTNRSTQPLSGFDATKFGIAVILSASGSDLLATGCNGYALAFGGSGTRDYRLVKFSNGLGATANLTTIISGASLGLTDGREYVSVKITYDPSSNTWKLFERNDGTGGPFGDPATLTDAHLIGSTADAAYTSATMSVFGFFWSYSVSTNTNNAFFDNFKVTVGSSPAYYFYNGTGSLNSVGSWGANVNGSGANPPSFTANKQIFSLQNTASASLSSDWTVSGTNSKVTVGDGTNPVTLIIAAGTALNADVDISANAVVELYSASLPRLGSNSGTLNLRAEGGYALTANMTIPAGNGIMNLTSGDLNTGGNTLTVNGKINLAGYKITGTGGFVLGAGGSLTLGDTAGIASAGASGAVQTASRSFSADASYAYAGTGACRTGSGLPASVANLSVLLGSKYSVLTLENPVTVSGTLTFSRGKIKIGDNSLTFASVSGHSDSGYVITNGHGNCIRYVSSTALRAFPIGTEAQYRRAAITFSTTPTPSYISARYVPADPGISGSYPDNIVQHHQGYWFIGSDGEPLQPYTIELETAGMNGITNYATARILKRANSSAPWAFAGTSAYAGSGSLLSETGAVNFSEFTVGGGTDNPLSAKTLSLTAFPEGWYNAALQKVTPDTLRVYLAAASSPYAAVDSCAAVTDSSGAAFPVFEKASNTVPYFVKVVHRNSIETWSAAAQPFVNSALSYDFSSDSAKAYGSNMVKRGGKWCLYGGDVNQDGIVDFSDLSAVDNAQYNFVSGYVATDITGDDFVDYSDLSLCDNNQRNFISVISPQLSALPAKRAGIQAKTDASKNE